MILVPYKKNDRQYLTFEPNGPNVINMTLGRPIGFDPDKALVAAMQVFWSKGYKQTSLQDLLKVMNLAKSSFYQTFGSKHQLFKKCITHYRQTIAEDMQAELTTANSGLHFIEHFFDAILKDTKASAERRGCLILNSASEFSQSDAEIAALIAEGIDQFIHILMLAVKRAQKEGDIPPDRSADSMAPYLFSCMSGLKTMVKAGVASKTLKHTIDVVLDTCKH